MTYQSCTMSLETEVVSSWRTVLASVSLAFILMISTGLALNLLAPWDYARTGLLYFRLWEAASFFLITLVILIFVNYKRPHWRLEKLFFRCIVSVSVICTLSFFIALSSRELAQIFLFGFACLILLWVFFAKFLRESLICMSVVIALLVIPFDIIFSSPFRSTEGRSASVQLLKVQYGLVRETPPGTYSMGCVVPPNPLTWVLWIDLWPLVDQVFVVYDDFFHHTTRVGYGS